MRRILLALGLGLVAGPLLIAGGVWLWLQFDQPTAVEGLLDGEPMVDLSAYERSDPPTHDAPSMLILGVPHLAPADLDITRDEVGAVVSGLAAYEPDLVAVEYLPPQWPSGEGRDYRPALDVDVQAERWGMTVDEARAIVDDEMRADDPCQRGRAYLLVSDLANAYHQWAGHDCDHAGATEGLRDWATGFAEHEIARIASPAAWENDVDELVSIDYQGEDARWFLHEEALTFDALSSPSDLWQMLPEVNRRTRELSAHLEAHDDQLVDLLDYLNSPDWVALQYWSYEQALPEVDVRDVGQRQRDSYWRRNERMFERLHDEAESKGAQRILVIVGAGHRYFLDELAREHGYRWIDPRDWLPASR